VVFYQEVNSALDVLIKYLYIVSDNGFEPSNDPIAVDRWVKAEESSPNVEAPVFMRVLYEV